MKASRWLCYDSSSSWGSLLHACSFPQERWQKIPNLSQLEVCQLWMVTLYQMPKNCTMINLGTRCRRPVAWGWCRTCTASWRRRRRTPPRRRSPGPRTGWRSATTGSTHRRSESHPASDLTWYMYVLRDKMICAVAVRFGIGFLRTPLTYQPCCLVPYCLGKLRELPNAAYKTYCTGNFVCCKTRNWVLTWAIPRWTNIPRDNRTQAEYMTDTS